MSGLAPDLRAGALEPLQLREVFHLEELNRALAFGTPLDEALNIITDVAHELLRASTVALVLQRRGAPLRLASRAGIDPALLSTQPVELACRLFGQPGEVFDLQEPARAVSFELDSRPGVGAPITVAGRMRGAIVALREPGDVAFNEHYLRLLGFVAVSVTTAVHNAVLLEAERRKTKETKALGTISKVMAGTLELDQVLRAIGDQVLTLLPVDRCAIGLVDETGAWIVTTYVGGVDPQLSHEIARTRRRNTQDAFNELALTTGRTVTVDRADASPLIRADLMSRYGFKSAMSTPLVGRNCVLGCIYVDCTRSYHHWTANERRLVEALAEEAAVAIQATQLYHRQREEAQTSTALLQVATALGRYNRFDDIMRAVVEITPAVMNTDQCFVWLWDPERLEFRPLQAWGLSEELVPAFQSLGLKMGETPCARQLLEKRAPVIVDDARTNELVPRHLVETLQMKSLLAVPLLSKGEVVGVLNVAHTRSTHHFKSHDITIAQGIANLVGLAIDNARLSEQAVKVEALRRLDRLKTELLANVSHELRTPLQAIKGLTEMLLEDDLQWDKESERDFLRTVAQETGRLQGMVEDLLDMSRIDAGTFRMHMAECDVGKMIRRVSTLMRHQMGGRAIEVSLSARLRPAWADEQHIGQVLTNLLQNAHKHTPAGLPVRISAGCEQGHVVVRVRDHGPGIPEEYVEHIFERFYQLPTQESTNRGAGLGLAICRGIVEAHAGRIWVESRPNAGTTFAFTLSAANRGRRKGR